MKNIVILLFLGFSVMLSAQPISEIKPLTEKLIRHSVENDFDAVLDLTYPKVFELASREDMKALFANVMENEQMSMKLLDVDSEIKVGKLQEIQGNKYVVVTYNNFMQMKFKNMEGMDPENFKELIATGFKGSAVEYNPENKAFEIRMRAKSIAISDEYTEGKWRFLNANTSDKQMLQQLLDEEILKELDL